MQRIIGITFTHENDALGCATRDYRDAFQTLGYDADVADVSKPEGIKILEDGLFSGDVAFCFGLQGVGSNLKRGEGNLWEKAKVPFLGLHYDNPCYNIHNHSNASRWVANVYHARGFLDIRQRYMSGDQINRALPFRLTAPMNEGPIPFHDRPIRFLFLKSGAKVDEFTSYFDSLPPPLRDGVYNIIRQTEANPNLIICDLVSTLLEREGFDLETYKSQFWAVVQSLDYYLRRKRALNMAEWLKLQPGALVIGDGWDFLDPTGSEAEFRHSMPLDEAVGLYAQTQFVFNANPYGADIVHERIVCGLMSNCSVISDTNHWWDERFSDVPSLLRMRMNQPLDDQILPFIERDPGKYSLLGRAPALAEFAQDDNYAKLIAIADEVRQFAS